MSIRFKLLISYILMIIIPIALFVLFLHLLFRLFVGNIEEVKNYYNIEENFFDELLSEDLILYTNLQNYARTNPDQLRDQSFLRESEDQLDNRKTAIIIRQEGELLYQSQLIDEELISLLPQHSLSYGNNIQSQQGYLKTKSGTWLYMYTDFYFSDGQEGSYFLVLDVDPISSFINKVVPILIVLFLLAFIVTNGALTYFLSRNIIRPLNEMKEAANQIKEGNLAYSLKLGRKDELGELNESFEEMRIRLKESLETQLKYEENRKELISNISHDLKTPITAIKGYIEGIQDGVADSPEKRAKYLKTIHTKANHMDRLIDELLLFSKLDMNSIPFKFEKVNISQFIADLVEGLKLDLEKKEVALIIENKLLHETFVLVDQEKFQRAMMNIVTNSIKFMDKEERRIVISLTGDVDNVLIAISDNGMGIKEHDLPRVIERFYRADSSRNTKLGGSGIGLAIVKQIMEAHHGSMEIESEYGVGTTIYLSLREWRDECAEGTNY